MATIRAFGVATRELDSSMGHPRLATGIGNSPRVMISVTDMQRQILDELSAQTGRSTADLVREALDAWVKALPAKEVAKAS